MALLTILLFATEPDRGGDSILEWAGADSYSAAAPPAKFDYFVKDLPTPFSTILNNNP